jgi:hypothetical protein
LDNIKQAIEIWLDLANRQMGDDFEVIKEAIEMRLLD